MTVARLEHLFDNNGRGSKAKASNLKGAQFSGMLDAASAMAPVATTAGQLYGSNSSAAVLAAAFSGVTAGAQNLGTSGSLASFGSTPSFAGGYGVGVNFSSMGGLGGLGSNNPVVPGVEGFSQMDMINTMNHNNLHLLELQATMQNNMQGWNTKSNILSADHRARMAMIEKFTARG